ncbi:MAG: hypothetical protein Ta2B_29290 [Termitinemataceae bacterium]|nr:MAG: hypothetical protein Ta2B_29290 [Termitinemataceae bacterium]
MSCWIKVKQGIINSSKYNVVRVFVIELDPSKPDESAKVGQCVGPFGYGENEKFRITLPESYEGQSVTFGVELAVINSGFDNLSAFVDRIQNLQDRSKVVSIKVPETLFSFLDTYPIALGLLKARYTSVDGVIPKAGHELTLDITDPVVHPLAIGYGPNSIQLKDLRDNAPSFPAIYTIDVVTKNIASYGFTLSAIIATDASMGADFSDLTLVGLTAPELDWVFVALNSMQPGDEVKLWFLFTAPEDGHACPCGITCNVATCSKYTISGIPSPYREECFFSNFTNSIFFSATGPPEYDVYLPLKVGTEILDGTDKIEAKPEWFELGEVEVEIMGTPTLVDIECDE